MSKAWIIVLVIVGSIIGGGEVMEGLAMLVLLGAMAAAYNSFN